MLSYTQKLLISHKKKFENNPKWWKHYYKLRTRFYASKEWKALSAKVRKKFEFTCQNVQCGGKAFDVHHIKSIFAFPHLALRESNLALLCRKCHKIVHLLKL